MENRRRNVDCFFRASPDEAALIDKKFAESGIKTKGAYLRKMAIDGYVIRVDLQEIRNVTNAYAHYNNNINQIAHHLNSGGAIYQSDLELLRESQQSIKSQTKKVISLMEKLVAL